MRTVVVKLGIRGKDTECKEMRVGVQRLVLVTPMEKLNEKLKRNYRLEIEGESEFSDFFFSNPGVESWIG